MNQKELLEFGKKTLNENKVEDCYIKAKKLLEYILNQTSNEFIINSLKEVSKNKITEYERKLQEIINGKPIQYITNTQEFMGLNFFVNENVLIPQPDTEILVETAIEKMKNNTYSKPIQVLDICTGSGCIGISIAKIIKNVQVLATDISKEALEISKKNAIINKVEKNIQFACSNLFENIGKKQFDYILSNPPYIETSAINDLPKEVKNEPHLALDGGKDGLKFYKEILKNAYKYLLPKGYLILEIGYKQAEKVINIYKENKTTSKNNSFKKNIENEESILKKSSKISEELILETKSAIKDLGGNDRVLIFKKA